MTIREKIEQEYPDSKMLFLLEEEFDDAIIGVDDNRWEQRKGDDGDESTERVIYSVMKIMYILVSKFGLSYEKAQEHFDINIIGGYVGIHTPIFCQDEFIEMWE